MDNADDISSTCENESMSLNDPYAMCSVDKDSTYGCDSETDYESDNEMIDICENSEHSVSKNPVTNSYVNTNKIRFFEQNRVLFPTKSLANNICNNDSTRSVKDKSKTFLIDNILGNDKNSDSKFNINVSQDDGEIFEESTDEHNGKKNLCVISHIILQILFAYNLHFFFKSILIL